MRVRKLAGILMVLALIVGACTDGGSAETTEGGGDTDTTAVSDTTAEADGSAEDTTTTQPETDDRDNVELTFTMWAAGPTQEAWQALADGYVEVDPRVSNVTFEFVPFPRYHDVLNVRLSSGEVQNGGWLLVHLAPQYIKADVLTEMEPVFSEFEGYEFDQIVEPARTQWQDADGSGLYAYPFAQSPQVLFYNRDAFAEAGVPTPQELLDQGNWTYETLRETARLMQESGTVDRGFIYQVDFFSEALGWRNLDPIYSAYQGRPWSEDGTTCEFDSAEMIQAFQLVHDMIFVDGSMRGPGESNPSFWAGQGAMGMYHNAAAQAQAEGADFGYGMVPQPSGPDGWFPSANTSGIVVFKDAPNADIASEFLAWLTKPDNATELAKFHSSPRVEILEPSLFTEGLEISEEEAQAAIIDTLEVAWRGPAHENWAALDREVNRIMGAEMWTADAEVAAVMDNVCNAIDALLGS